MPSVNKFSFLERNNIYYKQKSEAKQTQKKLEDSFVQMLMKTGEGWITPSLPLVRVNQGGLHVEGHLFVTVNGAMLII